MYYNPKHLFFLLLCTFFAAQDALSQPCTGSSTNVGGITFKDFNASGVKDATETLQSGIEVKVYNCTGALVGSDISDANGNWFVTVPIAPSATVKYRVEFTIPAALGGLQAGASGTGNKTNVQFVSAASCTVNFGVNYPSDYCQANPNLLTSCYTFGNQITGGNNAVDVLVSFPNNSGNTALNATDAQYSTPTTHSVVLKANQIGTTWGLAYARLTNRVYAASFFKKHTGFGKGADGIANNTDDAGAVYVINPSTNTVSSIFTVPNATTNSHNTADYLVDNGNTAWDAVGKISLGGMDISDDEDSLFVMNLQDRKLYALNPLTGAVQNSVAMPTTLPGCGASGDARPFAVEYYRGRVYVGIICSGESNQLATSVNAYVYEVNPATMVVSAAPVFQMDMDYTRGKANNGTNEFAAWRPWFATYRTITTDHTVIYPQPIITSLAFDNDNLILGFRDRIGDQVGQYVPANPSVPASGDYEPRTAGDILRACGSLNSWTLEINGRCGGTGSAPQNSNQGPGKGEFYYGDAYSYSNGTAGVGDTHDELALGGVLQIPGFPNVATTVFDPIPNGSAIFDGGVRWQSNTTGNFAQAYRLYDDLVAAGDLGKANGLGDLIALCAAAPIEIGNYVWIDTDKDGIQDACETPLAGVQVSLYKTDGTLVATKTTDATGNYYFKDYQQYGTGYDTLTTNTQYYIVAGKSGSQFNTGTNQITISGTPYTLTAANTGQTPNANQNDNNGTLASGLSGALGTAINGFPHTTVTTGAAGYVNHTLDFGFKPVVCEITSITAAQDLCNDNGTPSNPADDYYLANITVIFSDKPSSGTLNLSGAATASVAVAATTSSTMHTFSAVQLPANGTIQTLTAAFSADALCTFTNNAIPAVTNCQTNPCVANATTIGGVAFKDYNENGVKAASEGTQAGIIVHVFDCNSVEVAGSPVTTDANGNWFIAGLTFSATSKYRVEFTIPPSLIGLQPAVSGTDNKTDVQFVSAASCTVNFGVNYPSDYCQINARLATTCMTAGNPLTGSGTAIAPDAIVSFPVNPTISADNIQSVTMDASTAIAGSVWGVAYNKNTKKLFSAALLKRHVGWGTQGIGGLYVTDYSSGTAVTTSFINLATLGVDVKGAAPNTLLINGVGGRSLSNNANTPTRDIDAFAWVGKTGLGDIDLSDNNNILYVTNLATRTIIKIDITQYNLNGTLPTAANITTISLPTISCNGGVARPFGLKYYRDKLYAGITCTGETSGSINDVNISVYSYDGTSWTNALPQFTMNYTIGPAFVPFCTTFNAWSDVPKFGTTPTCYAWSAPCDTYPACYPEPMLSDIEFDKYDNMLLGVMDRSGHQWGFLNQSPDVTDNRLFDWRIAGDILKAGKCGNATWSMENKGGICGAVGTAAQQNNQGPGGGEYFYQDLGRGGTHQETSMGGFAYIISSDLVPTTSMDAVGEFSGGIIWHDNSTGASVLEGNLYSTYYQSPSGGNFGKANGLGDVEVLCNAAPIEIGNYVWNDADKDGVQDACEAPLSGVKVALYKDVAGTLTKIAEKTTNASGEYYFSAKDKLGATWTGTGADTTLLANQAYKVVFGQTQYAGGLLIIGANNYNLTQKDATTNTGNDQNDSDAAEASIAGTNYPTIALTTGAAGSVNHTLDIGFYGCPTITMPSGNQSICVGSAGTNITVQTNQNTASSIKFVKFTTDQMVGASPTATEAAAIYAGTTIGSTVTPSGGASPYTATYTWNSANFPNATNATITYYVYAIIEPDGGAGCRPTQEIRIIVNPLANAGIATNPAPICQNVSGLTNIDLFTPLAGEMTGGTWSQTAGTAVGAALDTTTGILNPNGIASGTYTFRYTVSGIAPCPNDTEDVTITIQNCCPPKICLPVTVARN